MAASRIPMIPAAAATRSSARSAGARLTPRGEYQIVTLRPGVLPAPGGGTEAPHLNVSVFARGLLDRVVTRIYFPDQAAANAADPVLSAIADPDRRTTLIAKAPASANAASPDGAGSGDGGQPAAFRFDITLQGGRETVFFDV